jgi:hypothetical protein
MQKSDDKAADRIRHLDLRYSFVIRHFSRSSCWAIGFRFRLQYGEY